MKLFGLHGFLQNSKKFTIQCHALTRKLKRVGVEVIFLNGPYLIPDTNDSRSWISDKSKNITKSEIEITKDEREIIQKQMNIEEKQDNYDATSSYHLLMKAHEEHPDVIGILAFSMGSTFALHLASHAATYKDSPFNWIKVIVAAASPFYPEEKNHPFMSCFPCKSEVNTLFVIGLIDDITPAADQRKFIQFFPKATIFEHEFGHFVPSSNDKIQPYFDFFNSLKDV